MFGKDEKEPSFKEAVRKIAQEEFKDYSDMAHRLDGEIESIKKTLESVDSKNKGIDPAAMEQKVREDLSEMRKNFSKSVTDQETRTNELQKLVRSLEERLDSVKGGGKSTASDKIVDNVRADMKTLEKTVFDQFDQLRGSMDKLSTKLATKARDIESVMSLLNKFQDEARALSSENFIKDMGILKSKISQMEKDVAELKAREPVVLE